LAPYRGQTVKISNFSKTQDGGGRHFEKSQKSRYLRNGFTDLYEIWYLKDKQLVIIDGEEVFSKPPLSDLSSLAPCTHEKADSRMLLHASHAARHGHHNIMIRTVDTVLRCWLFRLPRICSRKMNCELHSELEKGSDTWQPMK